MASGLLTSFFRRRRGHRSSHSNKSSRNWFNRVNYYLGALATAAHDVEGDVVKVSAGRDLFHRARNLRYAIERLHARVQIYRANDEEAIKHAFDHEIAAEYLAFRDEAQELSLRELHIVLEKLAYAFVAAHQCIMLGHAGPEYPVDDRIAIFAGKRIEPERIERSR